MVLGNLLILPVAFLGGILSILTPCSGVLVPLFFSNLLSNKNNYFKNTLLFTFGALIVAIPVGLGFAFISQILQTKTYYIVIGTLLVLSSFLALFGTKVTNLNKLNTKYFSKSFVLGVFASASIGVCTGPILGLIATIASSRGSYILTSIAMIFYVFGILFPLIVISLGLSRLSFFKKVLIVGKLIKFKLFNKKYTFHSTNIVSFVAFLLAGLLFLKIGFGFNFYNYVTIDTSLFLDLQDGLINKFSNNF